MAPPQAATNTSNDESLIRRAFLSSLVTALTPIFNLNASDIAILIQQIVYLKNNKLLIGIRVRIQFS
jgi:hypothetical protein